MTDDIAIRVENLGKMYRIYDKPADRLKQLLWGRYMEKGYGREFWALRNVNFTVRRGETVGIVGRNGSGKSTLLQMIAGTLAPSSGSIFVNGRVAALLELGSGFSPDLTGRENAIMQASLLGLSESEIAAQLPKIIQFADIGEFINQPTRIYSSGMTMRVAFAAAIHASAQVLIVDEALTVGDEGFVRKCFERVRDFQRNGGTLLFVSHAAGLVADICDRAILMHNGSIIKNSTPRPTLNAYHSLMAAKPDEATKMAEDIHAGKLTGKGEMSERAIHARFDNTLVSETQATYGDGNAEISSIKISGKDGIPVNVLIHGDEYKYTYSVKFSASFRSVRFGMLIKTKTGIELSGATTAVEEESSLQVHQNDEYEISFDWKCSLLPGVYFANAGVSAILDGERRHLCRHLDVIMFRVESDSIIRGTGLVDIHRCSNVTKVI